jgi:hypothetical protein
VNCCLSNLLSGSTVLPSLCEKVYGKHVYSTVRKGGGGYGVLGPRPTNTCRKVPLPFNFLDDDILHCLLWVLSFYGNSIHVSGCVGYYWSPHDTKSRFLDELRGLQYLYIAIHTMSVNTVQYYTVYRNKLLHSKAILRCNEETVHVIRMNIYSLNTLQENFTIHWGQVTGDRWTGPMATKFTYKMRSGGNGMWGRGPAQRKNNIKKTSLYQHRLTLYKNFIKSFLLSQLAWPGHKPNSPL